ncbi:MAG TPA: hypothetical protein PKE27_05510 [Povalibacter sp.]|uniref:hypothetical protein n=1 Tax=Povalibacter sp. TaxID=1962978 RepID=UPI002CDE4778|nr:hypothetical protein [Povalibacter sp.]HMN44006.1 hypothetical protein [Povalibacter sp.]
MLRYSIADEMLYGTVAGKSFSMKACSGGGRGSSAGLQRKDVAHWNSQKKAPAAFDEANRGGPLPAGHYLAVYIGPYKTFGECARLDQTLTSMLYSDLSSAAGVSVTERDGFLIHGEGPKGSDGCIVPASKVALKKLLSALKAANRPVLLEVHTEGVNVDRLRDTGNIA